MPVKDQPAVLRVSHSTNGIKIDSLVSELFLIPDEFDAFGAFDGGDPEEAGDLVDINFLPRIPDSGSFVTPLRFVPRACGPHTLVVATNALDGSAASAEDSLFIAVTVDPVDATQSLIDFITAQDLPRGTTTSLTAKLRSATSLFARGHEIPALNKLNAFVNQV